MADDAGLSSNCLCYALVRLYMYLCMCVAFVTEHSTALYTFLFTAHYHSLSSIWALMFVQRTDLLSRRVCCFAANY